MYSGEDSEWPLMYTFLLTSFFVFCLIDIIFKFKSEIHSKSFEMQDGNK